MVSEAKKLIEGVIRKQTPIRDVALRKTDEDTYVSQKRVPYASLLTADGKFDEQSVRYIKLRNGASLLQVHIRGTRSLPIEVKIAAKTEQDADRYLGNVLRYLPTKWQIGEYRGTIHILTEHHDDYASNAADRAVASAYVQFSMDIGTDPEPVPQIGGADVDPAPAA